jgi:hypothetical protein
MVGARARDRVGFSPDVANAFDGGPVHAMRLGFTPLDEAELEEAARGMGSAMLSQAPMPVARARGKGERQHPGLKLVGPTASADQLPVVGTVPEQVAPAPVCPR